METLTCNFPKESLRSAFTVSNFFFHSGGGDVLTHYLTNLKGQFENTDQTDRESIFFNFCFDSGRSGKRMVSLSFGTPLTVFSMVGSGVPLDPFFVPIPKRVRARARPRPTRETCYYCPYHKVSPSTLFVSRCFYYLWFSAVEF